MNEFVEVEQQSQIPTSTPTVLVLRGAVNAAEVALSPWTESPSYAKALKRAKRSIFMGLCHSVTTEFVGNEFSGFSVLQGTFQGERFQFDLGWNPGPEIRKI